jgi:competence protein ComEC
MISYRDYLAAQHIHSYMSSAEVTVLPGRAAVRSMLALYDFKERHSRISIACFPILNRPDGRDPARGGYGLTQKLSKPFNTGTHIIAISGFNISIIAGLFVTSSAVFIGPCGCWWRWIGIIFYTVLVGGDAAVVRAASWAVLPSLQKRWAAVRLH